MILCQEGLKLKFCCFEISLFLHHFKELNLSNFSDKILTNFFRTANLNSFCKLAMNLLTYFDS
nr:hypothetical protein [uncultured bacterium]